MFLQFGLTLNQFYPIFPKIIQQMLFVSDSPATQYRNKTMFYFLACQLHLLFPTMKEVSWNYLESEHRKSAPNGIGGVTKRTADRLVAEGKNVGSFETSS